MFKVRVRPKVVLDTNIFISSIFWRLGAPHKVVELALDKRIQVFISVDILKELEKVLRRDFEEPEEMILRQLNLILSYATLVKPRIKLSIVKEDEADNRILEAAREAKADYMITGDKRLLALREFKGTKIVAAKEFIENFSEKD